MMTEFYLLKQVPTVLRARDFRLYTDGGRRLVDLWQNGGAAILGHTPPSLLREIKNTASRGLYAPFPHFFELRFKKALACIFPDRVFRLYSAPPPVLQELMAQGKAALWRPFINPQNPLAADENAVPVLIPVIPGIQGWDKGLPLGLCVLAVKKDMEEKLSLPSEVFLPPVLLAAAARGIYDLIGAAAQRANPQYPRIFKALKKNGCQWSRRGLYISPKKPLCLQEWAIIFKKFLDAGFLIPPVRDQAIILPGILSPGEESKLAEMFA